LKLSPLPSQPGHISGFMLANWQSPPRSPMMRGDVDRERRWQTRTIANGVERDMHDETPSDYFGEDQGGGHRLSRRAGAWPAGASSATE
jgi:hypothetical protein